MVQVTCNIRWMASTLLKEGTLVIPLGDFEVMFAVNTPVVLPPIPFGVRLKYPLGIISSPVEYYPQYAIPLDVLSQTWTCMYHGGIHPVHMHNHCSYIHGSTHHVIQPHKRT